MKGVFLDRDTLDRSDLDFSQIENTLPEWDFFATTSAEQSAERIHDAEVVVTNKVVIDRALLLASPRLKLICVAATGTNNIDLEAAEQHGVTVCNARGYATPSVVQHTFTLILALTTHLSQYQEAIQRGDWQLSPHFCLLEYPFHELAGKTLGVIGYGELGHAVADVARAFGMNILISQRPGSQDCPPDRVPLATLLSEADIVSLHCPLTSDTHHLISSRELGLMKHSALLINTARGGIVDEQALATALQEGSIKGAGVDVLTQEPAQDDNPLLALHIPNLIITPHIAWASVQARQRLLNEISLNIEAFQQNQPRNMVSPNP